MSPAEWRDELTDGMIAAHVHADRVLVTRNVRDFRHLEAKNVMTPDTVVRAWGR